MQEIKRDLALFSLRERLPDQPRLSNWINVATVKA